MTQLTQKNLDDLKKLQSIKKDLFQLNTQINSLKRSVSNYIEPNECSIYFEDVIDFFEQSPEFKLYSDPEIVSKNTDIVLKIKELRTMIEKTSKERIEVLSSKFLELKNTEQLLKESIVSDLGYDKIFVYNFNSQNIPKVVFNLLMEHLKSKQILTKLNNGKFQYISDFDNRAELLKLFEESELKKDYPYLKIKSFLQKDECELLKILDFI